MKDYYKRDTINFKAKRDSTVLLSNIEGRYCKNIRIDGKTYFTFNKDKPYMVI